MTPKVTLTPNLEPIELTRREALTALAGLSVAVSLTACQKSNASAPSSTPGPDRERRATLSAAVDRIFPGAADAGALEFFARLFTQPGFAGVGHQFELGALTLNRLARSKHQKSFAECSPVQQDAVLVACRKGEASGRNFDSTMFFKRLVVLTMESLLSDPRHGGNKNQAGWKLIGHHSCHFSPRRLDLITHPERGLRY